MRYALELSNGCSYARTWSALSGCAVARLRNHFAQSRVAYILGHAIDLRARRRANLSRKMTGISAPWLLAGCVPRPSERDVPVVEAFRRTPTSATSSAA
jgi:hypothetical protein